MGLAEGGLSTVLMNGEDNDHRGEGKGHMMHMSNRNEVCISKRQKAKNKKV